MNLQYFKEFPQLATDRLVLREILPIDALAIYEMRSNKRVNQFIPRKTMGSLAEAEDLVERTVDAYSAKRGMGWAAILRDRAQIIGTCGFTNIEIENQYAEIGGELDVNFWGKGIAMEAVIEIVKFGLQDLGLHTIEARVSPANRGVLYILSELGFVETGYFKERIYRNEAFEDMAVYSLLNN